MCCRSNTLPRAYREARKLPERVGPSEAEPKPASGAAVLRRPAASVFVYNGRTGLTVVSPITGRRYRFERTGACVEVDPRDRSWMSFVPDLKAR